MKIAFYPAQSGKIWTGDALETGPLGGSETAVLYVACELAKLGHECYVFTRGTPGLYHDVVYLPFVQAKNLLRTLPLDVLVCSRDPLPLLWPHRAPITVLWLHDLPQQQRLPEATFYACVSAWQANIYAQYGLAPAEKLRVLPNGVDLALFQRHFTLSAFDDEYTPYLAWTSNPERGLWHAGRVLERVREVYPEAELHVFGRNDVYGWDTSTEHVFYPDDMTGVVLHEPLSKADLALALREMDLWVYPTWWPETYCIAAVEAQAAGVPVVASALGALPETAQSGSLIAGSMRDPGDAHLDAITDEVLRLLASVEERRRLQQDGLAFARTQSWSNVARLWETLLTKQLGLAA